eukprot:2965724-Rhodomonas_salina.2
MILTGLFCVDAGKFCPVGHASMIPRTRGQFRRKDSFARVMILTRVFAQPAGGTFLAHCYPGNSSGVNGGAGSGAHNKVNGWGSYFQNDRQAPCPVCLSPEFQKHTRNHKHVYASAFERVNVRKEGRKEGTKARREGMKGGEEWGRVTSC